MKHKIAPLVIAASLLVLASGCTSNYRVYSIRSKPNKQIPGGFLYALPHTFVHVAATFEYTDYSNAPYAAYAKELLGLRGIDPDSAYALRSIEISTYNNADPDLFYYVDPGNLAITIDSRGLLQSIGISRDGSRQDPEQGASVSSPLVGMFDRVIQQPVYNLYDRVDTFYTRYDRPGRPTMISTKKDSRSPRQRAVAAAEKIQELREKKQELLFGEYEGDYNTATLEYMCNQMDQQEQLLLEQFVGKVVSETVYFKVDPKADKEHINDQTYVLFYFSPSVGMVDSTFDNAQVVQCNIHCNRQSQKVLNWVRNRTGSVNNQDFGDLHTFKYRIPEKADVTVFSDRFSFRKEVKISQFGTIACLPYGNFKALFDPNTGDLVYFDNK